MRSDANPRDPVARALSLMELFCSLPEAGEFRSRMPSEVPEPERSLLDHRSHMTVAMERFHGTEVRLRVVACLAETPGPIAGWYAREILLESLSGDVIQYGIVRIDLTTLDDTNARAIRAARQPLGRILIDAGVLRDVHSVSLLEVTPGPHLESLFHMNQTSSTPRHLYGRVADILLNDRAAVELLEIVAPFSRDEQALDS